MNYLQTYEILKTLSIFFATAMLLKYFLFLLAAPLYRLKEKIKKIKYFDKAYEPLVSVIIPAWNEEVGILKTVQSVLSSTYKNIEVLIVNDGSTDATDKVMKEYISGLKHKDYLLSEKINYLRKENGGKGTALNHGIENSSGEIILTLDADSAVENNTIQNLVEYYKDPSINGVVGNVVVEGSLNMIGILQRLEYLFGFYFKRAHAFLGAEYIFGGACASFRKSVFEEIGMFDTKNKTEDIEMSMRARAHGYKCTYAEDAICYTEGASTLKGLISQRLRWKKGRFDTFIKYRKLFFSTSKQHNKWMSWFVLPYALLSELHLLIEPIAISLLVGYSVITSDYLSLSLGILFMSLVYLVNALFSYKKLNLWLLILFPFTWSWFYLLVMIEFIALIQSIRMLYQGEDIVWQKWQRKGIQLT